MKILLLTLLTISGCYAFGQEVNEAEQVTEPAQTENKAEEPVEPSQEQLEVINIPLYFPLQSCQSYFQEGLIMCMVSKDFLKNDFCPSIMNDEEQ